MDLPPGGLNEDARPARPAGPQSSRDRHRREGSVEDEADPVVDVRRLGRLTVDENWDVSILAHGFERGVMGPFTLAPIAVRFDDDGILHAAGLLDGEPRHHVLAGSRVGSTLAKADGPHTPAASAAWACSREDP